MAKLDVLVNESIPFDEIRLNGEGKDSENYGIVSLEEALNIAYNEGKDVILISDRANPPVCKLMSFGKYKYELMKKEKEAKKKQVIIETKEIRLSPNIDDNDLNVKKVSMRKILGKGDNVRVTLRFKGREAMHMNDYIPFMEDIAYDLSDIASLVKPVKIEGMNIGMTLARK